MIFQEKAMAFLSHAFTGMSLVVLWAVLTFPQDVFARHLLPSSEHKAVEESQTPHRDARPYIREKGIWDSAARFVEGYIGAYAGMNFPLDARNVETNGIRLSDLDQQNSLTYGVKAGIFPRNARWLGMELDAFNSTPHIKQQGIGHGETTPGILSRVTTLAFNFLLRYPGEIFQPYIGAGPAGYFSHFEKAGQGDTNSAAGLNAVLGLRVFLTDEIASFIEWKYNFAVIKAFSVEADYNAQLAVGGLSYHFDW